MRGERKPLILGNWKMHGSLQENEEIVHHFSHAYQQLSADSIECGICPPAIYTLQLCELLKNSAVVLGAQDVSAEIKGAYTGEISASMLDDIGCRYVIVGHSERRQYHHETEQTIICKVQQAVNCGLTPVYCVGEKLADREANQQNEIVGQQIEAICELDEEIISSLVIAYEPIWAIGTGKTANKAQAQAMHKFIRETIERKHPAIHNHIRVIYGGSVNENNADDLSKAEDIDGFLVGGASLKPHHFIKICEVFL